MCTGDGRGTFVGLLNSIIGGSRFCNSATRPLCDRLCDEYCGLRGIAPKHPFEQLPWCRCKLSTLCFEESEDKPDVPELIEQLDDKLESAVCKIKLFILNAHPD